MKLDPVLATILVALIAVAGGLIGAWLNSHLTTRRARWTFKRDLYIRMLEALHEATVLYETTIRFARPELVEAMEKEVIQVRRAQAVGRLVLDERASAAINDLDKAWRAGRDVKGLDAQVVAARLQALTAAYSAVLEAARGDLGMKARLSGNPQGGERR